MPANEIRAIIARSVPVLRSFSSESAGNTPASGVWSKKEILGHLIDSAANNHQRIVRGAQNCASDFPTYSQNRWVEIQKYNETNWNELVDLFSIVNGHLCRVIDVLPPKVFSNPCNVGKEEPVTLEYLIADYQRHLLYHLQQILGVDG